MARGLNKAMIIGNVGKEPEIRLTGDGLAIANFSVATSHKVKDKEDATEWHRIVAFGKLAEIVEKYISKGSKIYVEGMLKTKRWEDKNKIERFTTEIIASQIEMLGSKNFEEPDKIDLAAASDNPSHVVDDDIPF